MAYQETANTSAPVTSSDTTPKTLRIMTSMASSSATATQSSRVIRLPPSSQAPASPTSGGATYPASRVRIMPGPVGRPAESVSPEVSECSRMPCSLRPVSRATRACPPSCAMVTALRAIRQGSRVETTTSATAPVISTSSGGGSGCAPNSVSHRSPSPSIDIMGREPTGGVPCRSRGIGS